MPDRTDRLELARRLHDGLAQDLAALGYAMDLVIANPALADELRSELRSLRLQLIEINQGFRDEIYLLRNLNFATLTQALRQLFPSGLTIELPQLDLPPEFEDALSKALLEIGRNSAQHSSCNNFSITNEVSGLRLELVAFDNGSGGAALRQRSFGLASITEHLAKIGAQVECTSDQNGTRYTIVCNLDESKLL